MTRNIERQYSYRTSIDSIFIIHTYILVHIHECYMHVTCDMCVHCHWRNIKTSRKASNNLIIIHQTFHYQIQNNYLHTYTVRILFIWREKFC